MKKRTKIFIAFALSLIATAGYLALAPSDIARILRGQEGRYTDIATMERMMDKNDFSHLPGGFFAYRHHYKSGNWIQIVSSDSHHNSGGGTVGVLESSGERYFYFGHVCGHGEGVPLTYGEDKFEPDQSKFGHDKSDDLVRIK